MLYLKDKREARLFEIIRIEGTKVEKALEIILKEYDNVVSRRTYDIGNCWTIEHAIRLIDETLIVEKQDHWLSRKYEWIEEQVQIML